jgi:transposase-like protein
VKKLENGHYPVEFRRAAVEQLKAGVPIGVLAKRLGVNRGQLYRWRKNPIHPDSKRGQPKAQKPSAELSLQEELQQVKQLLAEKILEVQFFRGALQKVEARRQRSGNCGAQTSTTTSGK